MPIHTNIWAVGSPPVKLRESILSSEQLLEDMIITAPAMLSEEWMLIGRQERTDTGKRIDLLAVTPDGSLVLIELKRDRTSRDVVAQALDYAVWVETLVDDDIYAIYERFYPGCDLSQDFEQRFGVPLQEGMLNQSHEIIVVASELDPGTERIIGYLSERGISINVLFFIIFNDGEKQFISRSWLLDPVLEQANSTAVAANPNEPRSEEFYCSFGQGEERSWEDAVEFGFICGGGGAWYSRTLNLLNPGDRVWVNIPQTGYVGVGLVTSRSTPASQFNVQLFGEDINVLSAAKRGHYHARFVDDLELCEYFVAIDWLQVVPLTQAVRESGLFGNQNTVCRPRAPRWTRTVDRLKHMFPHFDGKKQLTAGRTGL